MLTALRSLLRLYTTYVMTLRDPCCDFVRPMLWPGSRPTTHVTTIATQNGSVAIVATQTGYVATILTQNGCVATLSKKFYAILHDPNKICCYFVRPKLVTLPLCATQFSYFVTFCDPIKPCCYLEWLKLAMLRLCATQISYVATLWDSSFCGMMEFRSQKIHLYDRFRSTHELQTSAP